MNWLYILLGIVAILQIFLFLLGRRIRKEEKENNVLLKYNIDSRQKAWQVLSDPTIPEEDRKKVQEIYDAHDSK